MQIGFNLITMKNFIRRCLGTTIISQLAISAFAQSWNLVWQEDFGVVPDSVYADFADPSKKMPGHKCARQGQAVQDGWYAIVSHVYNDPMGSWWYEVDDHTGNKDGGLLLCNTDGKLEGEIIYSQKIEFPICSTNKYKFVMYAGGSTNFGGILPSLEMLVTASDGTILGQELTGGIPMLYSSWDTSGEPTWTKFEVEFDPGNYDWVEFKLINRAECTEPGKEPEYGWSDEAHGNVLKCGSGNDFVLDDIQLFRQDSETVPDPDISNNSLVEETSLNGCMYSSSYSIPTKVLDDWHKLYKHIYFLWQESEDGYTWNDLDEPMSGINKTKAVLEVDITKSMQYRVIITGADASEAQAKTIAKQISTNGGPDDGCYLFSISNTLSAALPKPDCKYRSNLRTLWTEDFGVCDTLELKSHSNAVGTFYEDDGIAEFNGGKYVITSCPSFAISQKNSWNKMPEKEAVDAKDSKGKLGGAFLYGKTSLTDTVIYEKDFNGPFCNCKAYMFNVDIFKNKDWGTLPIHIEVLDGNDVIGEATGSIGGGNGGWITLSAPFQLPSDFNKSVKLRVSSIAKFPNASKDVSFGIDNLSVAICGETMPDASVYIDGKKTLTLLSGFDCNDETPHTVDFDGMADWIDLYPNAAFIWQSSVDGGNTWDNISATTTSIAYEGEPEILYRVVIGESSSVAEEVARNGKPADGCTVYYITNAVGFQCKESGCRAPKFSLDAEEKVMTIDTVFCNTPESVSVDVFQSNRINVDDFYIAKMGTDNKYGTASVLSPTPTSTNGKWTISLDKKSAKYMIYAMNDTCKSDTFYINVDIREKIELNPIEDQLFCANQIPSIKVELKSGKATSVYLKSGSLLGTANIILGETEVPFAEDAKTIGEKEFTVYAVDADEKCKSEEITFKMDYEDIPVFAFSSDVLKVCKGEKAELKLTVTPNHNSENHIYEIKDDKNNIINIEDLVVFPTEDVKYTATASSEICPTKVTSDPVEITVELPQAIDLSTVPSPALQTSVDGNIICAPANVSFTVSGDNLTTWDWEYRKKGESDFSKWEAGSTSISNSIEITEETSFRVSSAVASSNVCDKAYSEIITIQTEKKPEFTLALDKDRVCETGTVELSLVTTETYAPSQITATANGSPISLVNGKYSATISEKTKFEVIVAGEVCEQTSFDTTAYVDHPLSFTMTPNKTAICEGDDVTFTVTGASDGIVWYKSTDNRNYTEFTPTTENKIIPDQTIYVYAGTPSDGACEAFKVEPVKIEVEKALSFDLVSDVTGKICAGTPVNLSVKNLVGTPKTSKWEKNGIEVTAVSSLNDFPVSSSTYKVTLNGDVCPSVDHEVNIEVESADALSLVADKTLICEGESVTLTKDYGTNDPNIVTWWAEVDGIKTKITESTTVTPVKSTSYYLSVRGTVCDEVYSLPAIVDVEPKIDFELTTDVNGIICEGKEANISLNLLSGRPSNVLFTANDVADPYDIVKKNTYKVKPEESTTYSLSLAGTACNTAVIKTVDVKIQKQPKLSVSIDNTAVCEGDDVTITPTSENVDDLEWKYSVDGTTYTDLIKATSAQVLNPSQSIMYMIKTLADDACESVEWTQKVEVEPAFTVSLDVYSPVVCPGAEVEVNANVEGMSDNLKFEWKMKEDGTNFHAVSPTADPTIVKIELDATTDFSLTVSGKYCEPQTVTTTAIVDEVPTLILEASKDSLCEGDEVTLSTKFSSDNFTEPSIIFMSGEDCLARGQQAAVLNLTESTEIQASCFTSNMCLVSSSPIKIYVDPSISVEVPEDTTLCEGGDVKLSVNSNKGYRYIWSIGDDTLSTSSKFVYDDAESVNVKLEAISRVCKEEYEIGINVVPTPHIVSVEESGANKFEFVAEGGSGAYMYDFGKGYQPSSTLDPATYGKTYRIKVKDELGCSSDTTIVTPTYELVIPVRFTPNGDGVDDVWEVKNLDKYPGASVKLFDRFGKQLCDMTSEEMSAWDGTYNGHPLPATDYWYEIQIDEIDKVYTGHFTLIRY